MERKEWQEISTKNTQEKKKVQGKEHLEEGGGSVKDDCFANIPPQTCIYANAGEFYFVVNRPVINIHSQRPRNLPIFLGTFMLGFLLFVLLF